MEILNSLPPAPGAAEYVDVGFAGFFEDPGDEVACVLEDFTADRASAFVLPVCGVAVGAAENMHKLVLPAREKNGMYAFGCVKPGTA